MPTFKSFEEIEVWKKARSFALDIWKVSNTGTFSKDYKLKDQINGSAGSIMDNIAEGYERDGKKEFIQFLSIAKGSAGESKSQLYRALDRGHISVDVYEQLMNDNVTIGKQLSGFMSYLSGSDIKGLKYSDNKKSKI
jgi:four helix bundle protein